jgi:S1-C subfamily serine protease
VGGLSLGGFIAGAFVGSRLGPLLLSGGSRSPYAPLFTLVGAIIVGGILASLLEAFGFQVRRRMGKTLGQLDGIAGSVLVACFGLGLVWIAGAVALQTPGARHLRRDIQRSQILQALNDALPPSGSLLNALARFDPLPAINGPEADVPPPTSRIARDPDVAAAGRSVVRILGTACGLGVQGSGWIAENGIVVTNAHVVAGESDTTVQLRGVGPHYRATAIWFDSRNDVAVLRVDGIRGTPALRTNPDAPSGTSAAVLGFPLNGPYDVEPARLGQTSQVLTQDAYGNGPVRRLITSLRGLVRSGNSGGPVVDGAGRVVTTVFAATVGGTRRSGFGVPDTIVQSALRQASGPVDTGPCAR